MAAAATASAATLVALAQTLVAALEALRAVTLLSSNVRLREVRVEGSESSLLLRELSESF